MAETKEVRKRLTAKQKNFIEAYKKQATNVSRACESVKISRQTYYDWLTNLTFKEEIEHISEGMIDFAESMLYSNIKKGKESSILFFLKTRGRSRGYIEKKEIDMDITEHKTLDDFYDELNEE